jgi:hypothetical protein
MKDKKPANLEQFYQALESGPDKRSLEEVTADLKELGVDADNALARLEEAAQEHLKEERLAWRKEAAANKTAFLKVKEGFVSWASATADEIEKAYQEVLSKSAPNSPSFAFRNKTNLSSQDKARLLDSLQILRNTAPSQTEKPSDSAGT